MEICPLFSKKKSKTKHPTELDARLCGSFQCHNFTTCSQDLSSTACYPLFANCVVYSFGVLNWLSPQKLPTDFLKLLCNLFFLRSNKNIKEVGKLYDLPYPVDLARSSHLT